MTRLSHEQHRWSGNSITMTAIPTAAPTYASAHSDSGHWDCSRRSLHITGGAATSLDTPYDDVRNPDGSGLT